MAVQLRPLLMLLMKTPCTVKQLAAELKIDLNRAHYLMTRLEQAGVAVVERLEKRAGRPVKHYSIAPRWFIPFDVTSASTLEDAANAQILPRTRRIVENAIRIAQQHTSGRRGYWLSAEALNMGDEHGPADALFLGNEPFMLNLGQMNLSRADALRLKQRLAQVFDEFQQLEQPSEPPYTVSIMLVRGQMD
ncbi:ArsR family transcriptional regulator [Deinococcus cavernae]|uniref:ArsR family transcriptional regulator n=1 Tax=Deinococcus cavernae TaxID=2320857 RepID=A0A418V8R4_9DEIO|nr:ArsR family transcriptional regulator [Deinococcus cavernae]